MPIDKICSSYFPCSRSTVYDTEQLTSLQLASENAKKTNEVVDLINELDQEVEDLRNIRFKPYINVYDFGVKGEDVDVDTQGFKNALAHLESLLTGGILWFPLVKGGYTFNETITSTGSNITIDFNTNDITSDPTGVYDTDGSFIKFVGATDSHIRGGKFSWVDNSPDGSPTRPLYLEDCIRCSVYECEVVNAKDNAIWIERGTDNEIHHNFMKNPRFHAVSSTSSETLGTDSPLYTYVYKNLIEDVGDGLTALNVHSKPNGRSFYYDNVMKNCGMVAKNQAGPYTAKRNVFYSGDAVGSNYAFLLYKDGTIVEDNEVYDAPAVFRVLSAKNCVISNNQVINENTTVATMLLIDDNTESLRFSDNKIDLVEVKSGGKVVDSIGTTNNKNMYFNNNEIIVRNFFNNDTMIYLEASEKITFNNNLITVTPEVTATTGNGAFVIGDNSQCIGNNIDPSNASATVYRALFFTGSNGIGTNNIILGNLRIKLADSIIEDNNQYETLSTT